MELVENQPTKLTIVTEIFVKKYDYLNRYKKTFDKISCHLYLKINLATGIISNFLNLITILTEINKNIISSEILKNFP